MKRFIRFFNRCVDSILNVIGFISSLAIVLMALIVGFDVFARYTGHPTIWGFDVVLYLLIWVSFFGASYGLRKGSHFRVTLMVSRLGEKKARFFEIFCSISGTLFFFFLLKEGIKLVANSIMLDLHAPTLLRAPLWIPQLALPVGAFFLALVFLQSAMNGIAQHKGIEESHHDN